MKATNSIQKNAKTAGIAYLLIIGTSILSMIVGPYKLMVEGDTAATIANIASNQSLFRIGATYDLLMFIGVIILSAALYNVLKEINRTMAISALLSRTGEALVGSLSVICSFTILWIINGEEISDSDQRTIAMLFEAKNILMNVVFAFLGFGSVLFCSLFYKSRYIPRILAAFGIVAFLLVLGESLAVMLFSVKSTIATGVSAILFEITIGIWLTVKGVNTQYRDNKK